MAGSPSNTQRANLFLKAGFQEKEKERSRFGVAFAVKTK